MKLTLCVRTILVALACGSAASTQAATVWNESTDGDLSNDWLQPTSLSMAVGANRILGVDGDQGQGVDRDYFRFTVPQGALLTSVTLLNNTVVSGGASFFAIQSGPQITVTPTGGGAGVQALLGFSHYTNSDIDTNILPSVLFVATSGLPSGTYSVWVQETGGASPYGFDFGITAVPEPAASGLMLAGLLLLGSALRRR